MPTPQFSYPTPLPLLSTMPAQQREQQQQGARSLVQKAAATVTDFNPRTLRNGNVTDDLTWMTDTLSRILGMKPEGLERLDLPTEITITSVAGLIKRVASTVAPILLWPPLPDALFREPPKLPMWAGNLPLRNPFLAELDDDESSRVDRIFLEKQHPQTADFLKLEAEGGPSFKRYYQAESDLRLAKAARQYRGPNPYDQNENYPDQTARHILIAMLNRDNKILNEQLKAEAESGHWNPFVQFNLTTQMRLFKQDISLCYLLNVAGTFREMQLAAELAESEARTREARARQDQLRQAQVRRSISRFP